MTLNYDFDIFDTGQAFQEYAREIRELGMDPNAFGSRFALFRDPRTSAALRDADPRVCDCLMNSGFGLNNIHSGAPDGHYLASDEPHRQRILGKLVENFQATDFRGVRQSEFDMAEFLLSIDRAQPYPDELVRRGADGARGKGKRGWLYWLMMIPFYPFYAVAYTLLMLLRLPVYALMFVGVFIYFFLFKSPFRWIALASTVLLLIVFVLRVWNG